MPLYEYECEKCQEIHEVLKSFEDCDTEEKCPVCGSVMRKNLTCCHFKMDPWHMSAIMSNGDKVSGRFGRTDQLKGRIKS